MDTLTRMSVPADCVPLKDRGCINLSNNIPLQRRFQKIRSCRSPSICFILARSRKFQFASLPKRFRWGEASHRRVRASQITDLKNVIGRIIACRLSSIK